MTQIYQGQNGREYTIEKTELASGGEGSIYAIQGNDELVLKIFKPDRRTKDREDKLLKMIEYELDKEQLKQITWPQDVVYDDTSFVGYVMPRLYENRNLNVVYSTAGNKLDLRHRILIAYNLCAAVDTVHNLGQVCGDLNPQNICVNLNLTSESALRVTLVDTDSYHISDGDKIHRCEVGLANYLAPEIQKKMDKGQDLRSASLPTYTKETDLFALAVHIFALLMNGCHPFACAKQTNVGYENTMEVMDDTDQESVVLPQPIENIKDGFFPFYQQKKGVTYPLYAPDFKALPKDIQDLFVKAFVDGYENPSERPTTEKWLSILRKYQSPLQFEQCEKKHYYLKENSIHCPYCEANSRMLRMMNYAKMDIPNSEERTTETVDSQSQPIIQNSSSKEQNGNSTVNNEKAELGMWEIVCIVLLVLIAFVIWWGIWEDNYADTKDVNGTSQQYTQTTAESYNVTTTNAYDTAGNDGDCMSEDVFVTIDGTRFTIPCTYAHFTEKYEPWEEYEEGMSYYRLEGLEIALYGNGFEKKLEKNDRLESIDIWLLGDEYVETVCGINSYMTKWEVRQALEHEKGIVDVQEYDEGVEFTCTVSQTIQIYVMIGFDSDRMSYITYYISY